MILQSVEAFVSSHFPRHDGGGFLPLHPRRRRGVPRPLGLREGRVGLHNNLRVLSFLYRYSNQLLRAVVIYPRDGIDARLLGMAICWGLVADVPASVAQSRILDVKDFFAINAFDLGKIVDVPALERFKAEHRQQLASEWHTFKRQAEALAAELERQRADLASACQQLGDDLAAQKRQTVT